MNAPFHEPVMAAETVELLAASRGGLFVDCTIGLGGHSAALLARGAERLIGLDRDERASLKKDAAMTSAVSASL